MYIWKKLCNTTERQFGQVTYFGRVSRHDYGASTYWYMCKWVFENCSAINIFSWSYLIRKSTTNTQILINIKQCSNWTAKFRKYTYIKHSERKAVEKIPWPIIIHYVSVLSEDQINNLWLIFHSGQLATILKYCRNDRVVDIIRKYSYGSKRWPAKGSQILHTYTIWKCKYSLF